ncbi:casparian strip membrane protein 1-like isoform X1 [Cucumis sativus]|uniref:casparian strip membrane protein 1-like isoform X1 n=1 Tax=Cucumis sativus TaxID=3659 RepID=UPI0002B4692F|nr:casparian strip membrane protein 1-like isoform X1 [Cucumis sativus]
MGKTKTESGETQILGSKFENPIGEGAQRGLAIVDLVVRVMATMATLSSAIVMGTANQTLPFSTQTSQFKANYKDLPMFMFFVLANSIVCGYLFLSLPLSIFHIMEVASVTPRLILLIFDMMAMVLATAGASTAASAVYLAYRGNVAANWVSFCTQFDSFCRRISGSLIGSFGAVFAFMLLIIISIVAMVRRSS